MKIDIIFPVLNEEKRLNEGIKKTIDFLNNNNIEDYSIIIADNGSTDSTEKIAKNLIIKYNNIKYIKLSEKGVGLALRESIKISSADIVGYMDIDLSTNLIHLKDVIELFENNNNLDIVVGSRNQKKSKVIGRSFLRNITSNGLTLFVNSVLKTSRSDYMCGFKFFKNSTAKKLIEICSTYNGWFYCAEFIIVAEWFGYNIEELPVCWNDDSANSKVNGRMFKIIKEYMKQIFLLKKRKSLEMKKSK